MDWNQPSKFNKNGKDDVEGEDFDITFCFAWSLSFFLYHACLDSLLFFINWSDFINY
jgi:hypothetical protein